MLGISQRATKGNIPPWLHTGAIDPTQPPEHMKDEYATIEKPINEVLDGHRGGSE